jgi:hypothetical protein
VYCMTPSVGSTRAFAWTGCLIAPVTGTAQGGTVAPSGGAYQTAVWTSNTATGGLIIGNTSSKQVVDCFRGTIQDDALIKAVC